MLSELQRRVAQTFLAMPQAEGFALAGGAALILHRVVTRRTRDLDMFVADQPAVRGALDAFLSQAPEEGWEVEVLRTGPSFARLVVHANDEGVQLDLGYDYRWRPSEDSDLGPVLSVEELGVDKLLALFGRAEARDFVDVYHLADILGIYAMVTGASQKDPGFDPYHLAVNIDSIDRHRREEFAVDDATLAAMRSFFVDLRADLIDRTLTDPADQAN